MNTNPNTIPNTNLIGPFQGRFTVCKHCIKQILKILKSSNRIANRVNFCWTYSEIHPDHPELIYVKAYYSDDKDEWFFLNSTRKILINNLKQVQFQ